MNLEAQSQQTEYDAKAHLRKEWTAHRTAVDGYDLPDTVELPYYERAFYKTAVTVARYVYREGGEKVLREYVNTRNLDWQ